MCTFTMLRVERLDSAEQAQALRDGRFLVHGTAQVARREKLALRPYELAVEHGSGQIFAGRRGDLVKHGHVLHTIGLSGLSLRPLTTLTGPESEGAAAMLRPTRMRIVAQDETMASVCLGKATGQTPDEARATLQDGRAITLTRQELVQLLVTAFALLTRQRTDAAPKPVPLSAIFRTIARAEPILAPSAEHRGSAGLSPDNGQGMGWTDTCHKHSCDAAVLEPAAHGSPAHPLLCWTCPACRASYGALDQDERARFAALSA